MICRIKSRNRVDLVYRLASSVVLKHKQATRKESRCSRRSVGKLKRNAVRKRNYWSCKVRYRTCRGKRRKMTRFWIKTKCSKYSETPICSYKPLKVKLIGRRSRMTKAQRASNPIKSIWRRRLSSRMTSITALRSQIIQKMIKQILKRIIAQGRALHLIGSKHSRIWKLGIQLSIRRTVLPRREGIIMGT